jgi:hypothetical protein
MNLQQIKFAYACKDSEVILRYVPTLLLTKIGTKVAVYKYFTNGFVYKMRGWGQ